MSSAASLPQAWRSLLDGFGRPDQSQQVASCIELIAKSESADVLRAWLHDAIEQQMSEKVLSTLLRQFESIEHEGEDDGDSRSKLSVSEFKDVVQALEQFMHGTNHIMQLYTESHTTFGLAKDAVEDIFMTLQCDIEQSMHTPDSNFDRDKGLKHGTQLSLDDLFSQPSQAAPEEQHNTDVVLQTFERLLMSTLALQRHASTSNDAQGDENDDDENDDDDDEDDDDEADPLVGEEIAGMDRADAMEHVQRALDMLNSECVAKLFGPKILAAASRAIDACVQIEIERVQEEFEEPVRDVVLERLSGTIKPVVTQIKCVGDSLGALGLHNHIVGKTSRRLASLRIGQLFDIVVDFPDSEPAILDLTACLAVSNQREELVRSFRQALKKRLLHPGAQTTDIITQYVSTVKALRLLDPAGVVLERVCGPVRRYLQKRNDTVRCIVTSLTGEGENSLMDELRSGAEAADSAKVEAMDVSETWQPDPIDSDPKKAHLRRITDITTLLMNIYGSTELFVAEYRKLLSERLLSLTSFDTDREIRNLELLKLRFGEDAMHTCQVMLKDFSDSKRIYANYVHELRQHNQEPEVPLQVFVLSRLFWPQLSSEKFQPPKALQDVFADYSSKFTALKPTRTLDLVSGAGTVELDVELDDGSTMTVSVPPLTASILIMFEEQPEWKLKDLASRLETTTGAVQKRLAFWLRRRVLRQVSQDTYALASAAQGRQEDMHIQGMDEDEDDLDAGGGSAAGPDLDEHWSFIEGMLTNLSSLPLDRIYSMLKMVSMDTFTASEEELKRYLDQKVANQELTNQGGEYQLANSN